jgi:hypothetical protein
MFEDKACKRKYVDNETQYASGVKVTTVKYNRGVEQRGPTGINQPRKMETSLPTPKNDVCPFKIKIHFNKKDDLFYLSKHGSVHTHSHHFRRTILFLEPTNSIRTLRK